MNTFFNSDGVLNLDEAIMEMDSFRKIMDDGSVTDDEILQQAHHVTALLHRIEEICTPDQVTIIKEAMAELSVLYAVYHYKELQNIK